MKQLCFHKPISWFKKGLSIVRNYRRECCLNKNGHNAYRQYLSIEFRNELPLSTMPVYERDVRAKLRPQIFLAIIVLGILSAVGLFYGMNEIATGCTGGIIALGMKLMENE